MLDYAGEVLGADTAFLKSYSSFQTFYGVKDWIGYDLVFRYKFRYGYLNPIGKVPTTERFYLGGVRSVRGYRYNSIYPTTVSNSGNITYGGTQTFSQSLEASIPLIASARMRLAFFYDQGYIGNDNLMEKDISGYGAVIEWFAPIGPVNFVFSKALNQDCLQYESQFEFTIGQRF
jgi:outer membrane protein insertion porin family